MVLFGRDTAPPRPQQSYGRRCLLALDVELVSKHDTYSHAISMAVILNTCTSVVVMVTPIGLDSIGGNYFWIWAVICALFIPLIYFVSTSFFCPFTVLVCLSILHGTGHFELILTCFFPSVGSSASKHPAVPLSRWIKCSSTSRACAWA